jgi:ectoine hydroxylase-related dioxygenase (phytanoyl-CoA dioxygenase family)
MNTAIDYPKHLEEIDRQGYTVIENVLTPEQCARIGKRLDEIYAARDAAGKTNYPEIDPTQERILFNLHNKDPLFLELIDHPAILPILENKMEPTVIQNYFNARDPKPGCKDQRLHLDSRIPIPTNTVMMQVVWMIDDFSVENGATRAVPGSHKSGACPDPAITYPEERHITGKAGSVLLYNSSLWHGSSKATSPARRWGIISTYTRWFIKQSMDFTKNTPPELYARLTPRQKQLLGFASVPPHEELERIRTCTRAEDLPAALPR